MTSVSALTDLDKTNLRRGIKEISDSLTRIAAERDLIKDAISDLHDKTNVEKKVIRKLAKTYFKETFDQETEEFENFETMYETILANELQ